jgi:hypothetical protein
MGYRHFRRGSVGWERQVFLGGTGHSHGQPEFRRKTKKRLTNENGANEAAPFSSGRSVDQMRPNRVD